MDGRIEVNIMNIKQKLFKNYSYFPEMEHEACGVGLIATTDGKNSRKVVEYGIDALKAVWHRGAVDADGGEVALGEQAVELLGAGDRGDENHDLVELEGVEQVVELAVLLRFLQLNEILRERGTRGAADMRQGDPGI